MIDNSQQITSVGSANTEILPEQLLVVYMSLRALIILITPLALSSTLPFLDLSPVHGASPTQCIF